MKLRHITLKNFRSYYGEQTLFFTADEHHHVTIIHGANGAGKTSMFVAFDWCLYGNEHVRKKFDDIGKLENRRALKDDESAETMVEIGFTYRKTQYCARRTTSGNSKTSFLLSSSDTIGGKNQHHDEDASEWIKSIIPENVSGHFFFDGEQIHKFTEPRNEEKIKNAVRNILRIEEIGRGQKHLADIASEYRRQLKHNSTGNLNELLVERDKRQSELDKLLSNIQEKKDEIEAAEILKQDTDNRLKAIASSRALAQERNEIEQELQDLTQHKTDTNIEIRSLVNQSFIPLAKPVILSSLEIFEKIVIRDGIPKAFLMQLLSQTNCLCGRPILRESSEYQNISNLLDNAVSSESAYVVGETDNDLKRLLRDQVDNIPIKLNSAVSKIHELESKIQSNQKRLEKIKKNLGNFDDNEVPQLEAARARHESDIRNSEDEITRTMGRIEEINKIINQLDQDIKKEENVVAKAKQLKAYYELANEAALAMTRIYELHAADMREQIQEEVGPIFKKLIWNADHFVEINLTKDYKLLVKDASGENLLPEMSSGQRQVLSFSLIGALAKIAVKNMIPNMENEPFPIVMDTAFARLSREHRENIADIFPSIADQLVLFVTDEELHGKARENLDARIGAEYELDFTNEDSLTTTTTIRPIL